MIRGPGIMANKTLQVVLTSCVQFFISSKAVESVKKKTKKKERSVTGFCFKERGILR